MGERAVAPRPESEAPRSRIAGYLTLALLVGLGLIASFVPLDPADQWALALVALASFAVLAWRRVLRGTSEPKPLVPDLPPEGFRGGEMAALSRIVHRAERGLPFSQTMIVSRARAAFLERVRLLLRVPAATLREAASDPDALRRLIGDEVLAQFLSRAPGDDEASSAWVQRVRAHGRFDRDLRGVLARMEGWR